MIAFMKKMGNERARNLFERRAPVFYIRPKEYDLAMVRERWIRAKYEKRLFVKEEDAAAASSASAAAPSAAAASAAAAPAPGAGNERTASASMSVTSHAQSNANRPAAMSMGPSSSAAASSAASAASSSSAAAASAQPSDPAMFWAPERATEGWLFKENKKSAGKRRVRACATRAERELAPDLDRM